MVRFVETMISQGDKKGKKASHARNIHKKLIKVELAKLIPHTESWLLSLTLRIGNNLKLIEETPITQHFPTFFLVFFKIRRSPKLNLRK